MVDILKPILVFASGILAGFVNVVSAGGSFITIPALTFLGLGVDVANGTNRLAILFQNIFATWRFHRSGFLKISKALKIAIPMAFGALFGARIAVELDRETLKRVIGIILLIMVYFVLRKGKLIEVGMGKRVKNDLIASIVFFAVGIYGGFIQAGVGFFVLMSLLVFEGMGLSEGNAYKVFSILLYTPITIYVFVAGGKFDLLSGLVLSAGNVIGAHFGTKMATSGSAKWMRYILVSMMIVSAILFISGV